MFSVIDLHEIGCFVRRWKKKIHYLLLKLQIYETDDHIAYDL